MFNNIDVRLVYRLAGFSDKSLLQFYVEKGSPNSRNASLLIPDESYSILLYDNQPFIRIAYSGVVLQIVPEGYKIYGNSQSYAWTYQEPSTNSYMGYSEVGGYVQSITGVGNGTIQWAQYVLNPNNTFRTWGYDGTQYIDFKLRVNDNLTYTFGANGTFSFPAGGKIDFPVGSIGQYGMGWMGITNANTGAPISIVGRNINEIDCAGMTIWSGENDGNTGHVTINTVDNTNEISNEWAFYEDGEIGRAHV